MDLSKCILLCVSILFTALPNALAQYGNVYINGVIDGPLPGGSPKAVQLCSNSDITDLSLYGLETANNGNMPTGSQFNFPAITLDSANCIWLTNDSLSFREWFAFDACYESAEIDGNGDDCYILYYSGIINDVYGVPGTDGTGETWEYLDGWSHAVDQHPDSLFNSADWIFSGINALDGDTTNASAAVPYPDTLHHCDNDSRIRLLDHNTDEGTDSLQFAHVPIVIEPASASDIYLDVFTSNGTALAVEDYLAVDTIQITIPAGQDSIFVSIELVSDTIDEGDEYFYLNISHAQGDVVIEDSISQITILDDDFSGNPCASAWINEFHYDNIGSDSMEFIEIALLSADSVELDQYALRFLDGNSQSSYGAEVLLSDFTFSGTDSLHSYYTFDSGLQNGSPDGLLLYFTPNTDLCEFISYEGSFSIDSSDLLFPGLQSTDILVEESNSTTLPTESLQRLENQWYGPLSQTYGTSNTIPCTISGFNIQNSNCQGNDFSFEAHFVPGSATGPFNLVDNTNNTVIATGSSSPIVITIPGNNNTDTHILQIIDQADSSCVSNTTSIDYMDCITDGINCWDLNQNGINDPNEDSNGDGQFTVLDCQGANGIYSGSGAVPDSTHVNLNGTLNISNHLLHIDGNSGKIGIGSSTPGYTLEIQGDLGLSGQLFGLSDARAKTDVSKIKNACKVINKLKPVSYRFLKDIGQKSNLSYGLIAQEVGSVLPGLVNTFSSKTEEEMMSVDYISLIPFLISAIQEQNKRIDQLSAELNNVKSKGKE